MIEETAVIRLTGAYKMYYPGECASFPVKECQHIINKGYGVLKDPNLDAEAVGIVAAGDDEAVPDCSTHGLTLIQVEELVDGIEDLGTLQEVWNGEIIHPDHEGGRRGALKLLRARAKLLEEEDEDED